MSNHPRLLPVILGGFVFAELLLLVLSAPQWASAPWAL